MKKMGVPKDKFTDSSNELIDKILNKDISEYWLKVWGKKYNGTNI